MITLDLARHCCYNGNMSIKKYIIFAVCLVAIFGFGYWLSSPLRVQNKIQTPVTDSGFQNVPAQANIESALIPVSGNSLPAKPEPVVVAMGSFDGVGNHTASGVVIILRTGSSYALNFEDDFLVTKGPDLQVYLGRSNQYEPGLKLGPLQSATSSQTYPIPTDKYDVRYYDEAWIWNDTVSIPVAKAVLKVIQ
jgi:hypothetical protein